MNGLHKLTALWRAGGARAVALALWRRFLFRHWHSLVFVHRAPISAAALTWPAGYRYQWLGQAAVLATADADALRRAAGHLFTDGLSAQDEVYAVWHGADVVSCGVVMAQSPQCSVLGLPARCRLIGMCETVAAHRQRGLFSLALMQTVRTLREQAQREIFVEVDEGNMPSRRGIVKAGFQPWAQVDAQIWFGTWVRRSGHWHRVVRGDPA